MIKRKLISLAAALVLTASALTPGALAADAPAISAESAVLMEAETGRVLFEKDPGKRMLIASTTKIMTALVVLDKCALEEEVLIKPEYAAVEGSSMYLKPGEKLTVRSLLYGLMLVSGNDAATALACHTAGSEAEFAKLMNEKAKELGLENTGFSNPHGLDAEDHKSTAADMAVIMAAAMENKEFEAITSTKNVSIGGRSFTNHNKLLWTCPGMLGGKTGYTKSAGRTLVTCCEREGLRLVCVTLRDGDDWNDHAALYDWAFSEFCVKTAGDIGEIPSSLPVISGKADSVELKPEEHEPLVLCKADELTAKIILPDFIYAPVEDGDMAGRVDIFVNGELALSVRLLCREAVPANAGRSNIFKPFGNKI